MTTLPTAKTRILVWDAPTRIFHWMLALCFAGAYITLEGRGVERIHQALGCTMVGLVTFRVVWWLIGTHYARFSSFVRGREAAVSYATEIFNTTTETPVGHNPLGAASIVLMLLSTLATAYTGWAYIEGAAGFMLLLAGLHVVGVIFTSMMQGENLVASMVNGYKQGHPDQAIRWSW